MLKQVQHDGIGWIAACLLAVVAMLALATPASARDRIVVALQLEPPTLDPTSGAAAAIDEVTYRTIFEGLTTLDATGAAVPLLAASWEMAPDASSYVFHLRPNVRFSDGTPFDARIVRFSLLRAIAPGSSNAQAQALSEIAGIDILDPLTVRIRLSQSDAGLPVLLAWGDCVMVSPRAAGKLATDPVGTGPFLYRDWSRGDRLTLVRNDAYWGAKPSLARVEFRFLSDPAAAYAAVKTHAVDLFPDYPAPENLAQLRADPSLRVTTAPSEGEVILALNNAKGPLRDLRVRRAIAYALDRTAIIDGAMFGYGQPIGSHFPPQNPDYVDLTGRYPHNIAKARALLVRAGYPHGLSLTLKLPPPAYARRSGEIVAAQLAAVGIRATIVPVEWPQWLDEIFARHAYDMTMVSHAEPADYAIYGRPDYYFGYDGSTVRALLAQLKTTANPAERHALLGAVQRRIADDAVNGFLFQFPHLSVADARLTNLWVNTPLQAVDFSAARFAGSDAAAVQGGGTRAWAAPLAALLIVVGLAGLARLLGIVLLARRLGVLLLTLIGASLVVFALLQLAPGDPAQFMMGLEASPRAVAALRAELGLGGPWPARYFAWAAGLVQGDLGISYAYRVPVTGLIGPRLAVSLPLAVLAMLLSVLIGLPAALLAALRPGRGLDRAIGAVTRLGIALPSFWLAMVLLLVFAVQLRWLDASGFPGWEAGIGPVLAALVLPTVALALPQAALIARVARAALVDELARDYVRTARAKGLGPGLILWRHVLPNAAAPILAVIGLQFPFLLAGGVIVENVFYLPGLGRLLVQAITARDLIVVQAVAMLMVAATVVSSFLVDVAQALLDPRLRDRA
ncbi:ABC transporter substrate-binding protein [Sphingomonas crusticola]|uniref:ABC transporter substrate-binding protein n=1 Tax=Sphingomonas crusticola TaxID=1697973 RepID=UPI000E27E245|nr:ABC transporter substrate-binding protein [Sphingomonas crusticola]